MGVAQIVLDDIDLAEGVINWYKLFHHSSLASSLAANDRNSSFLSLDSVGWRWNSELLPGFWINGQSRTTTRGEGRTRMTQNPPLLPFFPDGRHRRPWENLVFFAFRKKNSFFSFLALGRGPCASTSTSVYSPLRTVKFFSTFVFFNKNKSSKTSSVFLFDLLIEVY